MLKYLGNQLRKCEETLRKQISAEYRHGRLALLTEQQLFHALGSGYDLRLFGASLSPAVPSLGSLVWSAETDGVACGLITRDRHETVVFVKVRARPCHWFEPADAPFLSRSRWRSTDICRRSSTICSASFATRCNTRWRRRSQVTLERGTRTRVHVARSRSRCDHETRAQPRRVRQWTRATHAHRRSQARLHASHRATRDQQRRQTGSHRPTRSRADSPSFVD
jgi:hypothetical protein